MGADQNLIRAASQMGPKEYDYSGILYLIQAMGKYANTKNAIADELVSYSEQNFNVKEFNEQFFTGAYGEQNMDFLTNKKDEYYKAMQIVKRAPSYTKKYKQAMKTINNIKFIFEKNKADAEQFVAVQQNANNAWLNRSAGMTFEAEDKLADIVTNPYTNKISASLVMSDSGLQVIAPSMMGTLEEDPLGIPVNEGMSPAYNEVMSLADIMMGYKENIVYKKVKLPNDQTQTLVIGDELNKLIEKYGKNAKQNGQPAFEQAQMEQELSALFDKVKKLGPDALRSIAYDYKIGDQTFVEATSKEILGKTDEEWVAMNQEYMNRLKPLFAKPGAATTKIGDTEFSVTPTDDEIEQMKKHVLASAFSTNNYADLQTGVYDYIIGKARDQYTAYESKVSTTDNFATPMPGVYLPAAKIPVIIKKISEEGYKENPNMNFSVGSVAFEYSKVQEGDLKGKMAWQYNYGDTYGLTPLPATAGPGTEGTSKSLHYFLDEHPSFNFLLSKNYKFKGGK